ncbi:MAG: 1-(5-phosphoribosyl)-5-[Clostridia bacterium]|nr:1-(5-phosphoribosyl)-5-[(5-phosphoribosylamino)methylideneamino]imidazole-4-carboxamide isomerase [Clostridia bacterium]
MNIFPAIDIIGAKAVRLTQGDYNKQKVYSDSPVEVARNFHELGAKYLHVVDLDGAKTGKTENYSVIAEILKATDMFVEVGGGIRDFDRIDRYLSIGVKRVILGTSALKNPEFRREAVKKYSSAIAVGVDTLNGFVATDGWLESSRVSGVEFCKILRDEGVENVIYTDISKDGALSGTNLEIYSVLSKIDGLKITASGGVSYMNEIEKLRDMKVYGAIVGKAIYENKLNLADVLRVAEAK